MPGEMGKFWIVPLQKTRRFTLWNTLSFSIVSENLGCFLCCRCTNESEAARVHFALDKLTFHSSMRTWSFSGEALRTGGAAGTVNKYEQSP